MSIPSGLSNQIGLAQQTTYAGFVTPSRFLEFTSESLSVDKQVLRARSTGDQFMRSGRTRHYIRGGGGQIELPVMTSGMGLLFKHMIGAVTTAQVGSTAEYVHTFVPDADGGAGDYLTVQKGLADTGGTVHPFNLIGAKVTTWTLTQALDALLMLSVTFDGKTVETASALAVASYADDIQPLSFIDAFITIDTVAICVRELTITGARALDLNRRCLGNTKREPVANGEYEITGTIAREFESMDQYDDWIAGTPAALVATWAYGEIAATGEPYQLIINIAELEYTGDTPTSNGSEITLQNLPFKALLSADDPLIEMLYHTSDLLP